MSTQHNSGSVLVVGAGIAGMSAAMHLAELGHPVYLLDSAPSIGGSLHLLDHSFPTNSCGLCLMLPQQPAFCPPFECNLHPNLRLLPYAELTALSGSPGSFRATLRHKARYVDPARCDGCAACAAACPEARPHDLEGWLAPGKAIFRPPGLRALPDSWLIDMAYCTRCGRCVQACPQAAIDLDMPPREETLPAGALLLTPGFAPFDARLKGEYGYGVYPNVLTALQFERMVSLAGSQVRKLARPSDGQAPRSIAFVHCVGSRDLLCGAGHCSSACCMYTAKQVALAKQINPQLAVTVYHMDLRAFGKDFENYLASVQALPGVLYRRAMPSAVHERPTTGELLLTVLGPDGRLTEEAHDLLVLAVGFAPPAGMQALAHSLGLQLNAHGFAVTDHYRPALTTRPGIFVAGAFREPKDIPETVAEAAGAAAEVASFLAQTQPAAAQAPDLSPSPPNVSHLPLSPSHLAPDLPPPPPSTTPQPPAALRDVSDEEPRIGVFVCSCHGKMDALPLAEVAAWAQQQPRVALAHLLPDACSEQGLAAIQATITAEKLNRVVLAACSPRLFAPELEQLMRRTGLDPRLLARVNLREQVLYPHQGSGPQRTAKACSLVAMAAAALRVMAGLETLPLGTHRPRTRRAVVVGGGAAGLAAALQLASLGFPVDLVEREQELGGQWRQIQYQPDGEEPMAALLALIDRVLTHPSITLHLGSQLLELSGTPGAYRSLIASNGQRQLVEHGALLLATGGQPASTGEYLYGHHPRVLTQRQLEQQLAHNQLPLPSLRTVVMIQCVGSRQPERPYCSRVCCTQAVKNALQLKQLLPHCNLYVLYRDVRTYGFRETYYQAAREAGVVFLRYDLPDKPKVEAADERLHLSLVEPLTGQPLHLAADLLVLSTGVDPTETGSLATTLGLQRNPDGFFREEHPKMKPLDLPRGGLFVAGLAHSPRFLDETIIHAQGAAMRAAAYLAAGQAADRPTAVWVNQRLCSFCGLCVEACPFQARVMNYDTRVADVDYDLCQGCGVCAVACPNKATKQKAFEHKQVMAAVDMALV